MATTTLQNLRRELGAYLGYGEMVGKDGEAWTTTTDIGAAATITSTELRDYGFDDISDAGSGDDIFDNFWVIILGTNNANVVRRVKSYDASAGALTVYGTNLSAESSAMDFELHKYSPTYLREALNTARLRAYPALHLPVTRQLMTANGQVRYQVPSALIDKPRAIYLERGYTSDFASNILSNAGLETFSSSAFTSWTATNLDIAQEEATTTPFNYAVLRDGSSARCTSRSSSTGTFLQSISSPGTHSGQRISMSVWVYCLTADIVSTDIKIGSTSNLGTAADGGLHQGTGWELLTHYEDAATTVSSLDVGINVVSSATDNTEFYVDEAICVVGPTQEPEPIADKELRNWHYVPQVQGTTLRNEVVFSEHFPDNYRLRFEGLGYLSSLSAETDTVEIGQPETDMLCAHAARLIYQRSGQSTPEAEGAYDSSRLSRVDRDLFDMMPMPKQRHKLMIPDA
jgi:hypothetical protein